MLQKTQSLGSQTKDFIAHGTAGSMWVPLAPGPLRQYGGGPGRGRTHSGSVCQLRLQLKEPESFPGAASKGAQPLPHKEVLSLLFWSGNKPVSTLEGDTISVF